MKLTNLTTTLKNNATRLLAVAALAGASLAATPAAQAQVRFGVYVGGPRYYAPAPRPYYYGPRPYAYGYGYPAYGYYGYYHHPHFDRWHRW